MNRAVIHFGLAATCAALLACVYFQHQRLTTLRAQEQRLLVRLGNSGDIAAPGNSAPASQSTAPAVSPDLLRLRSELTRLQAQKRELAAVPAENARLKERLAARSTGAVAAPAGLLTRENARFVGYNSPEDTVQSSFWALQNHDFTNLMQAFTPEMAERMLRVLPPQSRDEFLRGRAEIITNVIILDRTPMPDGSIELSIQSPENDSPDKTRFYLINGQWKIGEPPH